MESTSKHNKAFQKMRVLRKVVQNLDTSSKKKEVILASLTKQLQRNPDLKMESLKAFIRGLQDCKENVNTPQTSRSPEKEVPGELTDCHTAPDIISLKETYPLNSMHMKDTAYIKEMAAMAIKLMKKQRSNKTPKFTSNVRLNLPSATLSNISSNQGSYSSTITQSLFENCNAVPSLYPQGTLPQFSPVGAFVPTFCDETNADVTQSAGISMVPFIPPRPNSPLILNRQSYPLLQSTHAMIGPHQQHLHNLPSTTSSNLLNSARNSSEIYEDDTLFVDPDSSSPIRNVLQKDNQHRICENENIEDLRHKIKRKERNSAEVLADNMLSKVSNEIAEKQRNNNRDVRLVVLCERGDVLQEKTHGRKRTREEAFERSNKNYFRRSRDNLNEELCITLHTGNGPSYSDTLVEDSDKDHSETDDEENEVLLRRSRGKGKPQYEGLNEKSPNKAHAWNEQSCPSEASDYGIEDAGELYKRKRRKAQYRKVRQTEGLYEDTDLRRYRHSNEKETYDIEEMARRSYNANRQYRKKGAQSSDYQHSHGEGSVMNVDEKRNRIPFTSDRQYREVCVDNDNYQRSHRERPFVNDDQEMRQPYDPERQHEETGVNRYHHMYQKGNRGKDCYQPPIRKIDRSNIHSASQREKVEKSENDAVSETVLDKIKETSRMVRNIKMDGEKKDRILANLTKQIRENPSCEMKVIARIIRKLQKAKKKKVPTATLR